MPGKPYHVKVDTFSYTFVSVGEECTFRNLSQTMKLFVETIPFQANRAGSRRICDSCRRPRFRRSTFPRPGPCGKATYPEADEGGSPCALKGFQ